MNADDDGFCEVFTIMRMTDSKPDDLRSLHEKGFLFVIDSKVCIIKDWHENNQLRLDRYKKSTYLLDPKFEELYSIIMVEKIKEIDQYKPLLEKWQPNGNQMAPQVRLGEDSKDKDRIHTETSSEVFDWQQYVEEMRNDESRKDLNIIAYFFIAKELQFNTKAKAEVAIRRHLKSAKELTAFDKKEIGETIRKLNHDFPKFTLETVIKELTK